jgi:flagellar export protein FliJ
VRAEANLVRPKMRLDPVVRLKEQREQLSLRALADSARQLAAAEDHLRRAKDAATADRRKAGLAPASEWLLTELSHTRALADVRQAELAVAAANQVSTSSRSHYATAHSDAEALRKVTAVRVEELQRERDAAERRELDELAMLRRPAA